MAGAVTPAAEHHTNLIVGGVEVGSIYDWVTAWIWTLALEPIIFVILLFPTGRPPSSRWRIVLATTTLGLVLAVVSYAFAPGPFEGVRPIENPFGVEALAGLLRIARALAAVLIVSSAGLSVLSLMLRYRRADGLERQQLKWLAFAGACLILIEVGLIAAEPFLPNTEAMTDITNGVFALAFCGIPVAVGVAILRYRLYDIDRLINRTVVYALVSALLIAGYVGAVLTLQTLLPLEEGSPLVVAASTLVVVALFRPLRGWVQTMIDRRFYRSRFDARRTVDEFGRRVRSETELVRLQDGLLETVRSTMHPAHASLWLNQSGQRTGLPQERAVR